MAVISGGVVSSVVPALGVFDIPFMFRDVAQPSGRPRPGPAAALGAKFPTRG